MKLLVRTTAEEQKFQERQIGAQRSKYLGADVLQKIATDDGYRAKVEQLHALLDYDTGWILDVGSNTAGECEYLVSRGFSVIASDINAVALAISKERCQRFGRSSPAYVVCDGQHLPFLDESVPCAVFNESLHHMPDPAQSLGEVSRVLSKRGQVILYEPYAYDPWRRISEIRDYFRGSVETSFSVRQIKSLLTQAGLRLTHLSRPVLPPSAWKLEFLSPFRRLLRRSYYRVRQTWPSRFGMILAKADKLAHVSPHGPVPSICDVAPDGASDSAAGGTR